MSKSNIKSSNPKFCRKIWLIEVLFGKAALTFGRSSSAIKAFWRARTDLRYAPSAPEGLKHHRGIIKTLVTHAMRSGKMYENVGNAEVDSRGW